MKTTTQRTLNYLRRRGYLCHVGERWNAHVKRKDGGMGIRQDVWGIGDVIAIKPGEKTQLVQCTSASHLAAHVKKIEESPHFKTVVESDWLLVIHSWKKVKHRWQVKIEYVTT